MGSSQMDVKSKRGNVFFGGEIQQTFNNSGSLSNTQHSTFVFKTGANTVFQQNTQTLPTTLFV